MQDEETSDPIPFDAYTEELDGDPTTIESINARFARGAARMLRHEQELKLNTDATKANAQATKENGEVLALNTAMTTEMYEVFAMAKSGIEALAKLGRGLALIGSWFVKAIKVLAPLAVGLGALWHAFGELFGHVPPTK